VHSSESLQVIDLQAPAQSVELGVIVDVGLNSVCGMREAPHLIEHLLLSGTPLGDGVVDAIITLKAHGIKLSASTHGDYTEFLVSGPATESQRMVQSLATFLGRSSLPKLGFESEKKVIVNELRADDNYRSAPSLFDRFVASTTDGPGPCAQDSRSFLSYTYEGVQSVYAEFYTPESFLITTRAPADTFDLAPLESALQVPRLSDNLSSQSGLRDSVEELKILGRKGVVEIIFPIAGRNALSSVTANEIADHLRMSVQAYIRREYQLYTAKTFVDQDLSGGWLRLEVPRLENKSGQEVLEVAQSSALNAVSHVSQFNHGLMPTAQSGPLVGKPVLILANDEHMNTAHTGWKTDLVEFFKSIFGLD
tara:strand:- start:12726 stop:13820 length:1095 start_codon:yes stop_codon:yes gene_type:complete